MKRIQEVLNLQNSDFMTELIKILATLSKANICFFATADDDLKHAKTQVFYAHNEIAENFSYALKHTPCSHVLCDRESIFASNVAQLFPEDILLLELGIEGYVGMPIKNKNKKHMGILVGLYEDEIRDVHEIKKLYQMTADLIAFNLDKDNSDSCQMINEKDIRRLCRNF